MAITQTESWQLDIASLPTAAHSVASAAVGTKVYLFGGENNSKLSAISVYDKESNTITVLSTTLPTALSLLSAAAVGTKVYLFGGGGKAVYVFDTESNTITTLSTTLPTAAQGIASAVVGTKVYLFGGNGGGSYYNTINVFDTESNTITTLSTALPTAAYLIASAVVGTKVYLFGGGAKGNTLNTINVFDTESNTITTLSTTLPSKANSVASAVLGTKVYLFGGNNGSGDCYSSIYVFDTESNTILKSSTTLPVAAFRIASAVIGTKVYLFGGYDGGNYLSAIHCYAPEGTFEEPEEPKPTATVITYNGETIGTLEAGQTATIKTANTEVEHNIVVQAGSGSGVVKPILQEKTATENGEYLPDRGYDGFSKFTVDVPSGGGITLTDVKPTIKLATKITPNVAAVNVAVTLNAISNMSVTKGE